MSSKEKAIVRKAKRFYGNQPYDRLWSDMPRVASLFKRASFVNWRGNRLAAIQAMREIIACSQIAQAWLGAVRANVVGNVCPMPTFSNVAKGDREKLLEMWQTWTCNPTTDGGEDFTGLVRSLMTTMLIDGRVFGLLKNHEDYEYGLAIQPVPRDWLADQDVVATKVKYKEGEGINGVIRNPESGRISYYAFYGKSQMTAAQLEEEVFTLSKGMIGSSQVDVSTRVVLPRDKVLDLFCARDADDYEGQISHFAPALEKMQQLVRLDNALVTSMELSAHHAGFIEQDKDAKTLSELEQQFGDKINEEDVVPNPAEFPPASEIYTLQRGSKFAQFKHAAPNGDIEKCRTGLLMNIAASLNLDYASLSGDDRSVNYSSLRAAEARAKENHKIYQSAIRRKILMPVLKALIESAQMKGQLSISPKSLRAALKTDWRQKHFDYVDPETDMKAAMLQIQAGVLSPQALSAQLGRDWDQIQMENAQAKKIADQLEMPFPPGAPSQPAMPKEGNTKTAAKESKAKSSDSERE